MIIQQISSIQQVEPTIWNTLAGKGYPFMRHEFLAALEDSLCVSGQAGWQPRHILVLQNQELLAAMPLYLKSNSRGEFVFDQQWAYAYGQSGQNYYPKWLTAIPFTPCQGARIICKDKDLQKQIIELLIAFIKTTLQEQAISSWHCLFPSLEQLELLRGEGLLIRDGVQFQWFNRGYASFDDFLNSLNASKRKMLKKERRKITEQGIKLIQLSGLAATEDHWKVFYDFYQITYLKHGMPPYLNIDFFLRCAANMGEQMLLVFALKEDKYVGGALSFIGNDTLYGRYWGCRDEFHALHFEACYYQGLDYCIAHGLKRFDSGAQGEHKIARGFEPVTTYSAHWFFDKGFTKAVDQFLAREKQAVQFYKDDATNYLPFKK